MLDILSSVLFLFAVMFPSFQIALSDSLSMRFSFFLYYRYKWCGFVKYSVQDTSTKPTRVPRYID